MNQKMMDVLQGKHDNYIFPFMWVHGEGEETLRAYVRAIDEAHIKAICVESRPHPDFCGPLWWENMDVILDEATKRHMKVWILDDAHFPTGYAAGALLQAPEDMHRQFVTCRSWDVAAGQALVLSAEEARAVPERVPSEIEKMVAQMGSGDNRPHFADDQCLGWYALRADEDGAKDREIVALSEDVQTGAVRFAAPDQGQWRVYALYLTRNAGFHPQYINMLDEDSCSLLLEAVYEPHYAHYAKYFGTTIAGFFSDEPELGNGHLYANDCTVGNVSDLPWSEELAARLLDRWGADFAANLIYLWENGGDAQRRAEARFAYMDEMTQLVSETFSWQLGNWCRAHGVQYIGHLIEDNGMHARTGASLGHYFRGLAGQDMAGIDDIGGQVYPQGEDDSFDRGPFQVRDGAFYHYTLGKLASSLAALDPKKRGDAMCEIFGNYGWAEGVQLEKYLADHFLVRGVNHFVPHAFSCKDFPDPDCPPHFYAHGHNPQYRHFGALMQYMNRVAHMISGGRPVSPVALIYHAAGEWSGDFLACDQVGHVLYDHQIDYDIVPQEAFTDYGTYVAAVQDGKLTVNGQTYRAVVIPRMQYVTAELAEAAESLVAAGVPVFCVEGRPEGVCGAFLDAAQPETDVRQIFAQIPVVTLSELAAKAEALDLAEVSLAPASDRVRCLHYGFVDGAELYFFVNEGTETYSGTVTLRSRRGEAENHIVAYDAWYDSLWAVGAQNGRVAITLEPRKSIMLLIDDELWALETERAGCLTQVSTAAADGAATWAERLRAQRQLGQAPLSELSFDGAWRRSTCASAAYPQFADEKEVALPDQLEKEQPLFSGFVRYENTFTLTEQEAARANKEAEAARVRVKKANPEAMSAAYVLEITNASEGVEVFVNGASLGIQIVPTYRYLVPARLLRADRNDVRIEVATTLEREMSTVPNRWGMPVPTPTCASGICGEVHLYRV